MQGIQSAALQSEAEFADEKEMRCVPWFLILVICAFALPGSGVSAELDLPTYTVGTNTYSNVVITVSSKGRVLIEHLQGMASVKLEDLELYQRLQLVEAGLVTGPAAKEIERFVAKQDAATRKAEVKAARGPLEAPALNLENARKTSIVSLLVAHLEAEADAAGVEPDLEELNDSFGARIVYGISALLCFLSLLRKYLFFRICRNATGEGSFFVFIPVIRWFVLVGAANMSRHWLLVPMFAIVGVFLPPDIVNQAPWASLTHLIFICVLWFTTAMLYLVWCVKFCRAVSCSGWLALLLIFPVLDYIALFILAFAGSKTDSSPLSVQLKKPVLAV